MSDTEIPATTPPPLPVPAQRPDSRSPALPESNSRTSEVTDSRSSTGAGGSGDGPGAVASPLVTRLQAETRLMWVPVGTVAASGGADLLLHEIMMAGLHGHPLMIPISMAIGAAANGAATLTSAWVLAKHGAAEPEFLPLKRTGWCSAAAGAVLTLFGANPLLLGGYVVLAAVGTAAWYKARVAARRVLRAALALPSAGSPTPVPALTAGTPAPAPLDEIGDLVEIVGRWRRGVANTGPLANSQLTSPLRHPEGRASFILEGGPQGVLLGAANSARETIGSALRLKLTQDVVFDQPAELGLDRGQLRMQIINLAASTATAARVTEQIISAPDNPYSVRIGCYVDDGTPAYWDLADTDGAWSGAVIAGTGGGKSSFIDMLAYRARQLGFHVLFLDPQDGASSPILTEHATWPALGTSAAIPALRVVEQDATTRQKWMTLHNIGKITPGMVAPCRPDGQHPDPHCPCGGVVPPPLLIVIDECDMVFGEVIPGTTTKQGVPWGKLAKRIRKLCMGLLVVTQLPDVKAFGNDDLLRSNVAVRNLLAMHVSSNVGGNLIPGLPYSPKLLPKKSGRALMCGKTSRVMEITLDWMTRREDAGKVDGVGPFAEDLFAALPAVTPHPADAAAARRWMPHDGDPAATARTQARADYAAIMAGTYTTPALPSPAMTPADAPAPAIQAASLSWPAPVTTACPPPSAEELEAMYAAPAATNPADTATGDDDQTATEKTTADQAIWALLRSGVTQKGQLITLSGYSETQVRNSLNRGLATGRIRKDGHGRYEAVEVPAR